jgi:hypothetical protein
MLHSVAQNIGNTNIKGWMFIVYLGYLSARMVCGRMTWVDAVMAYLKDYL